MTQRSLDITKSRKWSQDVAKIAALPPRGLLPACGLYRGDALTFLRRLSPDPVFDLVFTSPPYNMGKCYETKRLTLQAYLDWQETVIDEVVKRTKDNGSICWQVGSYVNNGITEPLDIHLHPLFQKHGLQLRNRIVWSFGHGHHCKKRFSPRYEVVMWYTKSDRYKFYLNQVRIPPLYPSKRHYRGPNLGKFSGHRLGKNPEDVWRIPNVKGNHCEKTKHPCQFPVGLVERSILSMTRRGDLVFDPFAGVGSAGVAALSHGRRFWGVEKEDSYATIACERIGAAVDGSAIYRRHDKPIPDPKNSSVGQARPTRRSSQA